MKSLILFCLLFPAFIHAQQKPLSVGDKLPEEIFGSLPTNDKLKTTNYQLQTSNFKPQTSNKLIILDFFATWCTGCIKELPKLDSLQKKFNDRFQVILVSQQKNQVINDFRKKNRLFASVSFPVITNDSLFKKLFPHIYLPHQVWLNESGKILAISDPSSVTQQNIQAFLDGNNILLPLKIDAMDLDRTKPLFQNGNGGTEDDVIYRSMLTGYLNGTGKSEGFVQDSVKKRFYFINNSILFLYKAALDFEPNRIILEVEDASRYLIPAEPTIEWKHDNLYCYELTLPFAATKQTMRSFLYTDLNRYFSLNGRIEKRKMICWVLHRNNTDDSALRSKTLKPKITVDPSTDASIYLNQPVRVLMKALNWLPSPHPGHPIFIDETNIAFNIDMQLPAAAYKDIGILKTSLAAYGIELTQQQREIDMFILSETKNKPQL